MPCGMAEKTKITLKKIAAAGAYEQQCNAAGTEPTDGFGLPAATCWRKQ